MADVLMPRLSDSMEEGTILRWLKRSGEEVRQGEGLAEIETDKATITYEAEAEGVLEVVADEGETLPIGAVIARLAAVPAGSSGAPSNGGPQASPLAGPVADTSAPAGGPAGASRVTPPARPASEGASPPSSPSPATSPAAAAAAAAGATSSFPAVPMPPAAPPAAPPERVLASPLARRLAREQDVELSGLAGTGPGGRIVGADVTAAARPPEVTSPPVPPTEGSRVLPPSPAPAVPPAPEPVAAAPEAPAPEPQPAAPAAAPSAGTAKGEVTRQEPARAQQVLARRMAESKATIPDHTLTTEIDMERCVALRKEIKALEPDVVPSVGDMIVKACGIALREFPRANGTYRDGGFDLYSRVNVGIAVAAHDGLVVPTIFDVDQKSLGEIAGEARALARRVRKGSVTPPELSGGTFTVFDLGMHGVTEFNAVINPPQAAILAVGALERRPVVHKGKVRPRRRMTVSLTCDHRILYGAEAAEFLARIREVLERPAAAFVL